jgi:hypothetical protein
MKLHKKFEGWTALEEFASHYGEELLSRTVYFSEFYKGRATYGMYFNDLKLSVTELVAYRGGVSDIPLKWIDIDESTCINDYKLSKKEMDDVKEQYENELAVIHEKYKHLN